MDIIFQYHGTCDDGQHPFAAKVLRGLVRMTDKLKSFNVLLSEENGTKCLFWLSFGIDRQTLALINIPVWQVQKLNYFV